MRVGSKYYDIIGLYYRPIYLCIIMLNTIYTYQIPGVINQAIGQVSYLFFSMVGGLASLGELNSQVLSAIQALFSTFPFRAHVPFVQISYYSLALFSCLFLPLASSLLFPCARYPLCGIHTSCMGSPFPIIHAEWTLVFGLL